MKTLDELLADFPADWDVQIAVCCRGETHNGPPGVRRWTATAISPLPSLEALQKGPVPKKERLQSGCSETPREAILEVINMIATKRPVGTTS